MIKCRLCGIQGHEVQGVVLTRVNELGVEGVWGCRPICGAQLPADDALVAAIEGTFDDTPARREQGAPERVWIDLKDGTWFSRDARDDEGAIVDPDEFLYVNGIQHAAVVEGLREQLAQAYADNERLARVVQDIEEREAAVCPEDVGFDEYIRTLQRKLEARPQAGYPWTGNEP